MYRVLLVDDEPLVRITIKSMINWEEYGFEIASEACDGLDALEKINNSSFDIILTDISMPKMDGIELIRNIRRQNNNTAILVLSAYNEYNFVREAFKLGAVDYILKSDISRDSLLNLFKKAVEEIKDRKEIDDSQKIKSDLLKKEILENLIKGAISTDIRQKISELKIRVSENNIVVLSFLIDDYILIEEMYDYIILSNINNSIKNIFIQKKAEFNMGEVIQVSNKNYVYIISFKDCNSISSMNQKLITIVGAIRYALNEYLNISITIGISSMAHGYEDIARLYGEAQKATEFKLLYGKGKTIFHNDIIKIKQGNEKKFFNIQKLIIEAFDKMDSKLLKESLEIFVKEVNTHNLTDINKIYDIYLQLVYAVVSYLNEKDIKVEDIFGKDIDFLSKIRRLETLAEMNNWLKNTMLYIFEEIKDKSINKSYRLKKALEYIKDNYNKNISLKAVSEYVEVSETYLSRMFTKEVGESFISYVTNLRINTAKKLLKSTSISLSEISDEIGYENQEHFSRIFKKYVGMSPNKFRNE